MLNIFFYYGALCFEGCARGSSRSLVVHLQFPTPLPSAGVQPRLGQATDGASRRRRYHAHQVRVLI